MALPTAKELKALAQACRAAGITKLKQGDLELEFSAETPSKRKRGPNKTAPATQDEIKTDGWDSLSEHERLFWSAGRPSENESSEQ